MVDIDDVTLQRTPDQHTPTRSSGPAPFAIAAVLLLVIAAGAWFWWRASHREPAAVQRSTAAAPPAPAARSPEPGENLPLPPLDQMDPLVRQLVSALSSHPRVTAWLTTDGLIRNFAVSVLNIAEGRTPSRHLKSVAPGGSFQVAEDNGSIVLDPRSYQRYDSHADAVAALDARGAARLYATLEPRIEDAQRELGSPGSFDATLERAIVSLLDTPIVEGRVRLVPHGASYAFADPELESLTAAQRQFLRMGPRNMRIVQAKLREIARYLDIPAESLPPARVHQS
jgi:hypothetical protein